MPIRPVPNQETGKQSKNEPTPHLAPVRRRFREPPPVAGHDPETADPAYTVGYRKPPRNAQFKPGQSGNPKGRPKASKGLNTLVRHVMLEKVAVRTATGERQISRIEAVLHKTIEKAMKGDLTAMTNLMRLYAGAVPDPVQPADAMGAVAEELTPADQKILEIFQAQIISRAGEK